MKKLTALALALLVCSAPVVSTGAAVGPVGPAPNSGDGVSDGSGLDPRPGPNAPTTSPAPAPAPTPAPCSADGIADGSVFDGDCEI